MMTEDDDDDDDDDEIGVTDVIIEDSGYGYEAYPYGGKEAEEEYGLIDAKQLFIEQIMTGTSLIVKEQ